MRLHTLMAGAMALILASSNTRAADITVNTDIDLKAASGYSWRGKVLSEDAVFQPSATVMAGNFSFNLWGTWDLADSDNAAEHTRVDATFDYTVIENGHMVRPGIVSYVYYDDQDGNNKDTFEIFFEYAREVVLMPRLSVYYDFAEIEGFYGALTLAHGFTLKRDRHREPIINLDLRLRVGMGDEAYMQGVYAIEEDIDEGVEAFEPDGGGLTDLTAKVSLPVRTGNTCVITPAVQVARLLDEDIVDAFDDAGMETGQVIASLTVGLSF